MRVARPLKHFPGVVDVDWINGMLQAYGTKCEVKGCTQAAVTPYFTCRVFVFICEEHDSFVRSLSDTHKFDMQLAEHMYDLMLRKSYVHMNNRSGFVLEEMVRNYQEDLKRHDQTKVQRENAERRELRNAAKKADIKIGAPDDALLVGRQRNDLREKMGLPIIGKKPKRSSIKAVPSAELIDEPLFPVRSIL